MRHEGFNQEILEDSLSVSNLQAENKTDTSKPLSSFHSYGSIRQALRINQHCSEITSFQSLSTGFRRERDYRNYTGMAVLHLLSQHHDRALLGAAPAAVVGAAAWSFGVRELLHSTGSSRSSGVSEHGRVRELFKPLPAAGIAGISLPSPLQCHSQEKKYYKAALH